MTICYIYQDQFPWDIRVEKFVETFNMAGLMTHIVSRNRKGLAVQEEFLENVKIHRLTKGFGRISRSFANFPAFFSPIWLREIFRVAKVFEARVIMVRDLPLSPSAIFIGKILKIPVVIDMAENYPAMLDDAFKYRAKKFRDYLIRNPNFLGSMEKWVVRNVDGIIVVSEESENRILKLFRGGKRPPIWIVGNTPRLRQEDHSSQHPLIENIRKREGLHLLYVGGMETSRGLDIVIKALSYLLSQNFPLHFIVVGEGESRNKLAGQLRTLGLEKNVMLTGYIEQKYISSIIRSCDICIIPHYVSEHTDTTIPNKIFDYMAQGKPVLATHARTLRNIVVGTRCGYIYKDSDSQALAKCILALSDAEKRKELGENGRSAVLTRFNWDVDKKNLLSAVDYFLNSSKTT